MCGAEIVTRVAASLLAFPSSGLLEVGARRRGGAVGLLSPCPPGCQLLHLAALVTLIVGWSTRIQGRWEW